MLRDVLCGNGEMEQIKGVAFGVGERASEGPETFQKYSRKGKGGLHSLSYIVIESCEQE